VSLPHGHSLIGAGCDVAFEPQPVSVQLCRCLLAAAGFWSRLCRCLLAAASLKQAVSLPMAAAGFAQAVWLPHGSSPSEVNCVVASWPQPVSITRH
jgi:hypothetical protein